MIYALYSTDYELFLGANHVSEYEILIEPTERLLKTSENAEIPMNIFCDVASIWRYRELGMNEFPDQVENQLKSALMRSHDVQTHLHPHWPFARQDGKRWVYSSEKYLLGTLYPDPEKCLELATQYLKKASEYLTGLLRPVNSGYKCVAYRAGGFGLQPNESMILSALEKTGYVIDSSIAPGLVMRTNVSQVDFTEVPREPNYFISSERGLKSISKNGLFEIPIAASRLGYFDYINLQRYNLMQRLKHKSNEWDHRGSSVQEINQPRSRGKLQKLAHEMKRQVDKFNSRWVPLELRSDHQPMLAVTRAYLKQFEAKLLNGGDIYFSMLAHSKTLSNDMLRALASYQKEMAKIYGNNFKAITFQQAAIQIQGIN